MRLKPAPYDHIDKEWPFFEEYLLRIKQARGSTWAPRHVFAAITHTQTA